MLAGDPELLHQLGPDLLRNVHLGHHLGSAQLLCVISGDQTATVQLSSSSSCAGIELTPHNLHICSEPRLGEEKATFHCNSQPAGFLTSE